MIMNIDYAWTARTLIGRIVSESQSYRSWFDRYWRDRVRDALVKNSEVINEKAIDFEMAFRDISALTDKFAACQIDRLEESANTNFYNCTQLESEITSFRAESDAISKV